MPFRATELLPRGGAADGRNAPIPRDPAHHERHRARADRVDLDGPEKGLEVGPGEFVYRPAGSRHSAWTPEGGLMLAVFHVPNKFFEQDGSIVDLIGNDWGKKWGHVVS